MGTYQYHGDGIMLRNFTDDLHKMSPLKPTGFISGRISLPLNSPLNTDIPGGEIEGFPKGGKRGGRRVRSARRVPRNILRSGNKFDIAAGQRGMFKCPHLGHYCSGISAVDVRKCKGYEECHVRLHNKLIARVWEARRSEVN